MFRTLRRLWNSYTASIPKSEIVDSVPESQWDRADLLPPVSKAKRKAFNDLLALIYSHFPPQTADALVQRGSRVLSRGDEVDTALRNALLPEEAAGEESNPGFMACDWKAAEEVQWQANLLCQSHGLSERWSAPNGSLMSILQDLDAWLHGQGHSLLYFSDGDGLVAFALPTDRVASAIAIGKRLKLAIGLPSEA
jgi:hypothetical protein